MGDCGTSTKMCTTRMIPIVGENPSCSFLRRLEDRKARLLTQRLERSKRSDKPEDFILHDDSDSDEECLPKRKQTDLLRTSSNFVDFIKSREMQSKDIRSIDKHFGTRHILTHEMFRESAITLGNINKVFCSKWLSDGQVVFGTKCNRLMVYDVFTHSLVQIPSLTTFEDTREVQNSGLYSLQINPSRTLLATGARNSSDIAIYRLPTLDPVCVGQGGHKDLVFDMCWLDDEFLVSGSKDTTLALWRVTPQQVNESTHCNSLQSHYESLKPVVVKKCKTAQKIRAVAFNKTYEEIAILSLNGYIHIWSAETFYQKLSRKLPSSQEDACLAVQENGLYAIGCRSYTILMDSRTLQPIKKVSSRYSGCGIQSASFQGNILTIGTGLGILMFYDLKAGKYLESSINSSRTVVLKASRGYVCPDEEYVDNIQNIKYVPAIYTHCYDASGTRLFTAGGPLPPTLVGNYAGIWH